MSPYVPGDRAFHAAAALLFVGSAAVTVVWCASMADMRTMPMPGGWAMSMVWMTMPGQSWLGGAASFLAMWVVMMAAMMLPSLVPMLSRYRGSVRGADDRDVRLGRLTALVGAGYFFVWAVIGAVLYPLGIGLAAVEMQRPALARMVPIAIGSIVLIAGLLQFTAWKVRHLACCRGVPERDRTLPADARTAWRHGLHLGIACSCCSAGLTATLIVAGVMDLRVMTLVTVAVTFERLAPAGERVAYATGGAILVTGAALLVRAVGLG